MSLLGVQVQQSRTFHLLNPTQDTNQFLHIVTIKRTEVANVHTVKDVLLMGNGTLHSIRQTLDAFLSVVGHQSLLIEPTGGLEFDGVIGLVGVQSQQILFHAAHRTVDAHIVIIEDDQ